MTIIRRIRCDWCGHEREFQFEDHCYVLVYDSPLRLTGGEAAPQTTRDFEENSPDLCQNCFEAFLKLAEDRKARR